MITQNRLLNELDRALTYLNEVDPTTMALQIERVGNRVYDEGIKGFSREKAIFLGTTLLEIAEWLDLGAISQAASALDYVMGQVNMAMAKRKADFMRVDRAVESIFKTNGMDTEETKAKIEEVLAAIDEDGLIILQGMDKIEGLNYLVNMYGTENEKAGIGFGMWPLWAGRVLDELFGYGAP